MIPFIFFVSCIYAYLSHIILFLLCILFLHSSFSLRKTICLFLSIFFFYIFCTVITKYLYSLGECTIWNISFHGLESSHKADYLNINHISYVKHTKYKSRENYIGNYPKRTIYTKVILSETAKKKIKEICFRCGTFYRFLKPHYPNSWIKYGLKCCSFRSKKGQRSFYYKLLSFFF